MVLDNSKIGLRIRYARNRAGITQEQLADILNVSRIQVVFLENGMRGASLEVLVNIANALNVPISDLLADHLNRAESISNMELLRIILDCTEQEEKIITKVAKALRAVLLEYGV